MFYGIGILPNAVAVILLRCFYAVQDTVTPLVAEVVNLVFYTIVAVLLTHHFGIAGLACTRGLSFFLVTTILVFVLWRQKHLLTVDSKFAWFFLRTALACTVMLAMNWMSLLFLKSWFDSGKTPLRLAIMCTLAAVCGSVFLGMARLLKIDEASRVLTTVWQLLPGRANSPADDRAEIPLIGRESL
jgi:putative peptidoglycan lipid II flippase